MEKSKNAAVAFTCGQQNRILGILMMSSPHSSTSGLRPLNPAMPHNNNNGRLHACVLAAEDIEPTRTKCSSATTLSKKDYGQPTSHFHLLLLVFGFSFCCLFVYSHSFVRMLRYFFPIFGEFQAPPLGLEYELQRVG